MAEAKRNFINEADLKNPFNEGSLTQGLGVHAKVDGVIFKYAGSVENEDEARRYIEQSRATHAREKEKLENEGIGYRVPDFLIGVAVSDVTEGGITIDSERVGVYRDWDPGVVV